MAQNRYHISKRQTSAGRVACVIPGGKPHFNRGLAAEPAVHVLNRQVEEISSGVITQKAMQNSLSIGVAIALGIAMLRVLTGISVLWFIVPGYTLALLLTFRAPKIFTAIAFDSGGVASGPMTATFVLPFAMGACESLGGTVLHGRGIGSREAEEFFGITIQPEKEIVILLANREQKAGIMRAIQSAAGLRTEARGILFSLPVEHLAGLSLS